MIGTDIMVSKNSSGVDSGAIVTILSTEYVGHPSGVTHRAIVAADSGEWFVGYIYQRGQAKPRIALARLAEPIEELNLI